MPFFMRHRLLRSPLAGERWDGVVWYAPSIFHGPLAKSIKQGSGCKGYLIIRDIFPNWAVDMGLMGRGLPFQFFDAVARYQYAVADVIGVQTIGNMAYFRNWQSAPDRQLEVLQNWLGEVSSQACSISLTETSLAGRKVFVYAGNMGVAQGMAVLLDLAEALRRRKDVGFLFVGRGSEAKQLATSAAARGLDNVVFKDEIHPDEIPALYSQCAIGLVALDPRHKSHNIPGKFLTYMQNGLPVLAYVNAGNDLAALIRQEQVGQVCEGNHPEDLLSLAQKLLAQLETDKGLAERCRQLFAHMFSVGQAARQVVEALAPSDKSPSKEPPSATRI